MRRGFVDVPWGQLHYRETGSPDAPPLVFLHQTSLSSKSWEPVMELFQDEFHVLAPDTPGYGDSSRHPERPSMDDYVDALVRWMDGIGLERAPFVGHHTGSALGAALAARHPQRVSHLALSMPPFFTGEESDRYKAIQAGAQLQEDGSNLLTVWKSQARSNNERLSLELVYWDAVESLRAFPYGVWAIKALAEADLGAHLRAAYATTPLVILHNPVDPLIRHWDRIAEALPGVRRELIESTTVDYFLERADVMTPLIKEFVRS